MSSAADVSLYILLFRRTDAMADSGTKKNGSISVQKKKSSATEGKKRGRPPSSAGKNTSAKRGRPKGSTGEKSASAAAAIKKSSGSRLRDEITAVLLTALGIFLLMAMMTDAAGKFGLLLAQVLKGLFGFGAYILPFYVILCAVLLLTNRMTHINARSTFLLLLIYFDIVTVNSVFFDAVEAQTFGVSYLKNMYLAGISLDSAGAVGMTAGWLAVKAVGKTGLLIACAAVLLICCMLLINSSISGILDRRREKKYQAAVERAAQREAEEAAAMERQQMQMQIRQAESEAALQKESRKKRRGKKTEKDALSGEEFLPGGAYLQDAAAGTSGGGEDAFRDLRIRSTDLFQDEISDGGQWPSLTENKRHIIEYMNDDNLFERAEEEEDKAEESLSASAEQSFGSLSESSLFASGFSDFSEKQPVRESAEPEAEPQRSRAQDRNPDEADEAVPPERRGEDSSGNLSEGTGKENAPAGGGNTGMHGSAAQNKMSKSETAAAISAGAAEVAEQARQAPEKKQYRLPPLSLLNRVKREENRSQRFELAARAQKLETVLHDFGVSARVVDVKKGPSVTRYEIQPDTGVKVNSIVRLADDIALNLEAKSLRIEAPIPGKAAVGIEVENDKTSVVTLREMIESDAFQKAESKISFVVGEDISGNSVVADLKGMPHLLIAGATGSGKSVCINSIILSMLYKSTPDEVKFILIDPKVVELGNYNGIPHMLIPVITDPSKAAAALAWAVQEMNDRYRKFAETGSRDLKSYNTKMKREEAEEKVLPQIVIIIDELADLMMAAPSQVEEAICRLAQLARAAGMHLIVATQRPSVDIVTGLIKANIPSRIAFAVSSQFDSRTILDRSGAEKLVGKGDMLFSPIGRAQPERLQGPFVTDDEVSAVIEFWKEQAEDTEASRKIMESINTVKVNVSDEDEEDELLEEAVRLVVDAEHASASMLQRRFRIGYNRAARLVDIMEARGIIGPSEGSKPRRVLISKEEYYGTSAESGDGGQNAEVSEAGRSAEMLREENTTGDYNI